MYLLSIKITQLESYYSQVLRKNTLARMSLKYSNTKIVEYFKILIIEIGFGENTLTKKVRKVKIYPHPILSTGNPITPNK